MKHTKFTKYYNLEHPLNDYIIEKIIVLEQLSIRLKTEDIVHMYSLNTEIAIDNFCRKLIFAEEE